MRGLALRRPRLLSLGALLGVLVLAGCSNQRSGSSSGVTVSGSRMTIYAVQPPAGTGGQVATDVVHAEQLALPKPVQVGRWLVSLRTIGEHEVSADARAAVEDQSTIAYVGELVPGTSQVSVQITNEVDLLQVSPLDTAVYLTQSTPAVSNAPGTYYPADSNYHETFARLVPTTAQEAKAIVAEMQSLHVSKVYVAPGDGTSYAASFAAEMRQDVTGAGLTSVSAPSAADAIFYAGNSYAAAKTALDQLADQNPGAKLFAPSALYDDTLVAGLSASAQRNLYVSSPGFTPATEPSEAQQFASSFQSAYGHAPAPQAVFGYEAVQAILAVLRQAGTRANNRSTVVSDFRGLKDRQSAIGTYSIQHGDISIAPFIIARVKNGRLVPGPAAGQ